MQDHRQSWGLWTSPQLWWGVCGEAQLEPDQKGPAETGELFGLAQSLLPCASLQRDSASALECAGEGTATVCADCDNLGHGWWFAPCNCVTFTLCPVHTAVSVRRKMQLSAVFPPQAQVISGEQNLCTRYATSCVFNYTLALSILGRTTDQNHKSSRLCWVLPCVIQACQQDPCLHSHSVSMQSAA